MASYQKRGNPDKFRYRASFLIFCLLVGATVVFLYPLDAALRKYITGLRDSFIQKIEEYSGLRLVYDYASPSILGTLDIRNARLVRSDESSFLSVSRLSLSFSLMDLLKGKTGEVFRAVHVDRPVLSLDFIRDEDLLRLLNPEKTSETADTPGPGFMPDNFQIRIRNGEWEGLSSSLSFQIQNLNLDGTMQGGRIIFNGRWNARGAVDSGFTASMSGRASGDFSLNQGEGSAAVDIPSFTGEFFRLQPLAVNFFLHDKKLEIRKVYDRSPVDLALVLDLVSGGINASFRGDNFSPRDLFVLTGPLREYNSFMDLWLSGEAELGKQGDELEYALDLSGRTGSGSVAMFPFARLLNGASFAVSATGNEDEVAFRELRFDSAGGRAAYDGSLGFSPLTSEGTLSVSNLRLRENEARGGFTGDLHVSSQGWEIVVLGENISSGDVELESLDLIVFQEEKGLTFLGSAARPGDSSPNPGSFSLDGSLDFEPRRIQTSLKLDSFSLGDIVNLADPFLPASVIPEFAAAAGEDIYVTTEVFFTTDYTQSLYNAPNITVVYKGTPELEIQASLSGTDRRFELDRGSVNSPYGSAGLSGYADFSNPNDVSFSLEASYQDLVYSFRGVMLDRESLSIRGSYGFEVFFSSSGTQGYSGYAQAAAIPVPIKGQNGSLSFLFSLRYDSASFWSLDIEHFEFADIPVSASGAALRFSGGADQDGLRIRELTYDDGLGVLAGTVSAAWDSAYQVFNLDAGMSNPGNNERYRLRGHYSQDENLYFSLNVEGMNLERVNRNLQQGRASGNFRCTWDLRETMSAELLLPSVSFLFYDQMIRASAYASADNSEFLLRDIKINYASRLEASLPNFRINRETGVLETDAEFLATMGSQAVAFSIQGEAEFEPVDSWLDADKILDSFHGSLSFLNTGADAAETETPVRFELSSVKDGAGHNISLDGGPRNMLRLRFSPEAAGGGNIYLALGAPSPVRGSVTGFVDLNTIDIWANDLYVDMNSLWKFVPPNDIIAFPGGIVTAAIHITGSLRDPEFYGTAWASSLTIQVPSYLPNDIRPTPVTITIEGNEMRFGPIYAGVGSGYGMVSGWFLFERWIPLTFNLDIEVAPDNAIPVAFDISGIVASGRVSGHMILAMEDMIFDVYGDLSAHNTEITLNASEIAARNTRGTSTGPVSTMVNILVRSGRQVEFFWPSVEFPILQAYADVGSEIRIVSDVVAHRFSLLGDVNLRSGEIFYLERNFYLREGTLVFNEDESRFDPRITARAELRDQSDDGPVTIAMIIDNAPLRSFSPRFESNPPLSQLEILSMLGQSQAGGDPANASMDANAILAYTADALTQFTVMRTLQREVRNFLGLDMFSVRTRFLQNVVLQATGLQENSGGENFGTGNYFDNTTVFLGKYIGSDIFVESMFSWRYDPAKQDWGGMRLEPEIGLEMRNPLFNIRMNMLFLHPENWFINDISFSLTWRWFF